MENNNRSIRIIWAVDIPDIESLIQEPLIASLRNLAVFWNIEVQPVYVLNRKDIELPFEYSTSLLHDFERQLQKDLGISVKLIPSRIVSQATASLSDGASLLDEYAQDTDCNFIVVNTHGRKGIQRLTLGSFTEALLAKAKTSILVFSRQSKPMTCKNMKILFPTNYGSLSQRAFSKILLWASFLRAEVTIFHKAKKFLGILPKMAQDQVRLIQESFKQSAREQNVEVKFQNTVSLQDLPHSIIEAANNGDFSFIMMASQRSPVVRQVIRESVVPVFSIWVGNRFLSKFHFKQSIEAKYF